MVVYSLKNQRRLVQTKVHFKLTTSCKKFVLNCVIDTLCFDKCFLSLVISGTCCFFKKLVVTLKFFQRPCVVFFESSVLKEVRILLYFHNNNKVLIPFVAELFYDNVFYTLLFFDCSTFFLYKSFKKKKNSKWKHVLHNRRQNYMAKLYSMITHIIMSSFKIFDSKHKKQKAQKDIKAAFSNKILENADLHKLLLKKTMTT